MIAIPIWRSVKARLFQGGYVIADDRDALAVEIARPREKLRDGDVVLLTLRRATG
jgi:hypothetical protein